MIKGLLSAGIVMAILFIALGVETVRDRWPKIFGGLWLLLIGTGLAILLLALTMHFARARDLGQWDNTDAAIAEWYRSLMQPDAPMASCCGEADAYWCDDYYARDGKAFCKVTDDRLDAPRGRPHVDLGTEIEIPPNKLKWDRSNPTGHGVVFLSTGSFGRYVFCYVAPGGV